MSIAAIAGRRVDGADATEPRFPVANVPDVRRRIDEEFTRHGVTAVVSSAACGADLLAREAAESRGIESLIILPYAAAKFRETSVVDRPGADYWGSLFDRIVANGPADRLILLEFHEGAGGQAYTAVNARIIAEAEARARASGTSAVAIIAWEGAPRTGTDFTAGFKALAEERHIPVAEIRTR